MYNGNPFVSEQQYPDRGLRLIGMVSRYFLSSENSKRSILGKMRIIILRMIKKNGPYIYNIRSVR